MDDARFDAWTRRTFGAAMGGLAASLFGLATFDDAGAKNKKKKRKRKRKNKKKCKKLLQACTTTGKKTRCCKGLTCEFIAAEDGLHCCRAPGAPCTDATECCGGIVVCTNNVCTSPF